MKKLRIITMLLMVACIMLAICSCTQEQDHKHSYSDEWTADEKNHWHVCIGEGCDQIAGSTAHSFGDGVVTTPATEEAEGVLTKTCSVCGYEKTEAISKLPESHKHQLQKVEGIEPTCEDSGIETYYVCSCGRKFSDENAENEILYPVILDKKGHTVVEFGEYIAPNCDTAGYEKGEKCSVCGVIITAQKMIAPLAHVWDNGVIKTDPTCYSEGIKSYSCTVCGGSKTEAIPADINAHSWNGGIVTTVATCMKEGEITYTCTEPLCGKKKTETIAVDVNAHSWNDGAITVPATCSAEGEKIFVCEHNSEHTKTEIVAIDANAHSWNDGVITIPATCVAEGEKTYACKHNSEHTKVESVPIDENNHSFKPATCEIPSTCERCGNTTGEALGHDYTFEITTQPDCVNTGIRTYTCQNDHSHTYTESVDALGHDIVIDNAVAPTCIETGLTEGQHCSRCNDATVAQSIVPAKGHTYDNTSDPDCNVCGAIRDVACTHNNTEVIKGYDATCTVDGITDGLMCKDCGETIEPQKFIPAKGHTEETVAGKDATCTETGLTEGKKCSVCHEVLENQETVDALGHSPKEAVKENEKEADCLNAGSYDLVVYCSVCGEKIESETVIVGTIGHITVVDAAKAPTCEATGLTEGKHCGVCNTVLVAQNEIEKLSHNWTMTNVVVDGATVTYDYVCESCGTVEHKYGPIAQEKHVCNHTVHGIETEYGSWTECSCGARSWAQTALSAYKGSGATHTSVDVYVPNGNGGWTKTGIKVSDVATSYNLGTSGGDKSKEYLEFTYKITAPEAMTVDVFVNGRSTNTSGSKNTAVRLSKFIELYQDGNKVEVEYEALFPEYKEGSPYWTEQRVATIELKEGENTITFRYIKHKLSDGSIEYISGKVYGGYLSYFRFAEASKIDEGCESGAHNLELVNEKAAGCYDGVKAHYICDDCGKLFDLENKMETEEKYLAIPRIYHSHIYENVARLQDDGTYAYECTRGCGATRAHECTGGTHLIIAKEPNQVWYEEGDSFNPDRMEVYLSTACIEGCSGNTVVAGHLKKYDALTYTYQNGDSFKAGDTKITINYTLDGVTYSADLPVTVTAVGGTITVDDSDEGFSFVDASDDNRKAGSRTNDQGSPVGQSAYGGSYTNNFANGDSAKFTFTLDEAKNGANIVLRASSDRMNGAGGTPPCGYAISVNDVVIIKIDGQIVEFNDDVLLGGSVTNLDQKTNRWVWTNWSSLDLGTYDLGAGEHTVEIIINTVLSGSVAGTDHNGYAASIQLDCLNVFLGE